MQQADLILTMGPSHLARVQELGGGETRAPPRRASRRDGASADGVSDPFGGDLEVYRGTFDELLALVGQTLDRLTGGDAPPAR